MPELRSLARGSLRAKSGGDYSDVIQLNEGRLGICVGDVVGKGITAALLMANLQASFRAFATAEASPLVVCTKLNKFLCANIASGKFVTFFYAILDADAGFKVPKDISLIGFDDIDQAAFNVPRLTTIRQPLIRMGELAASTLIKRIERSEEKPAEILVEPTLFVRESTAALEGASEKSRVHFAMRKIAKP